MVLRTILVTLLLVMGCSEEKKVEVTPDAPKTVPVEEVVSATPLRDYERKLTPETFGADEYVFSLSWRMPVDCSDSVVIWKSDGSTITPEIILHSREPDYLFQSKSHVLKRGLVYEVEVRVLTDEAMEMIFEANYEAYQKARGMGELLRSIRIDLK